MTNREDFRFFRWLILILATGSVAAGAAPLTWHLGGHHEIEPPPVALPVQAILDRVVNKFSEGIPRFIVQMRKN